LFSGCGSKTPKPDFPPKKLTQKEIDFIKNAERVKSIKSFLANSNSKTTCLTKDALDNIVGFNEKGVNKFFTIKATSCTVNYNNGVPYIIGSEYLYLREDIFFQKNTYGKITGYYFAKENAVIYITEKLHYVGNGNYVDLTNNRIVNFRFGKMNIIRTELKNILFKNNVLITEKSIQFEGNKKSYVFSTNTNFLVSALKYCIVQGGNTLYIIYNDGDFETIKLNKPHTLKISFQAYEGYYLSYIKADTNNKSKITGYILRVEGGIKLLPSYLAPYKNYENVFINRVTKEFKYIDPLKRFSTSGSLRPIKDLKTLFCNDMMLKRCFLSPY
jgi:hypothetical protein